MERLKGGVGRDLDKGKKICKKDVSIDTIRVNVTTKISTDANATDANLTGKIIDISSNTGVKDANVSVGKYSTLTDINGSYSLEYSSERNVIVTVNHKDYFSNTRTIQSLDANKTLTIKIAKPLASIAFDASKGATLTQKASKSVGKALVKFPAGAYEQSSKHYSGKVHATMSYYDTATDTAKTLLPGIAKGQENSTTDNIESLGFIQMALVDDNGTKIELEEGNEITLTFPAKLEDNASKDLVDVPLSSFDLKTGLWKKGADATLTGTNYVGKVKKVDVWSLDLKASK